MGTEAQTMDKKRDVVLSRPDHPEFENEMSPRPEIFPAFRKEEIALRNAHVLPDYTVVVDFDRKYTDVSDGFCKLLGYSREELIGKRYDDVTAPRTNDIPIVFELFMKSGYMHGVWIFVHRAGTRILVRYEAWLRPDHLIQCQMELLGAGA
jgi:PAS domain S-box-containing protein